MSADVTFDPYEISVALRKLGVKPLDDPAQWTEQVVAGWPEPARKAVTKVLSDPVKLLASQLFLLDDTLISEDLSDLAALATEPVTVQPDQDRWTTDRDSVLVAMGAVLYEAARQACAMDDAPLPAASSCRAPDVSEWIPLMIDPVAHATREILPLFLPEVSPS